MKSKAVYVVYRVTNGGERILVKAVYDIMSAASEVEGLKLNGLTAGFTNVPLS